MTTELQTVRLNVALLALTEIGLKPYCPVASKQLAWDALDALAPELSILTAPEAWRKVRETQEDHP